MKTKRRKHISVFSDCCIESKEKKNKKPVKSAELRNNFLEL